jgi:threonylcarbamoyladenosine tRNA methylthiotransferase MtaB
MNSNCQKPTVALDSLGCKLNQAEMETAARQLMKAGYRLVPPSERADIYILNSCTVTHIADRKTRQKLRGYRSINREARLVVTGCYAERAPEKLKGIDGVDIIIGNSEKQDIRQRLEKAGYAAADVAEYSPDLYEHSRRTRSFIKIQDGCKNFCAYCIVPLVRSREQSVPADNILREIGERVAEGYREVVLTGTEIGQYRHNGIGLEGLISRILAETGIDRLRLSSLQPPEISSGLIGLWRDYRLCPHFHLSLQSGSDSVLSRMKRRYTIAVYRGAVSRLRGTVPDAALTTDVIVGFPDESAAEFQETLDFCREMQFARIHVFAYSPRPGTAAAAMGPLVSAGVKRERSRRMLALTGEGIRDFRGRFLGTTAEVLFERKSGGTWSGLTGNYIKVYVSSNQDLVNQLRPVKLVEGYRDGILGEIL